MEDLKAKQRYQRETEEDSLRALRSSAEPVAELEKQVGLSSRSYSGQGDMVALLEELKRDLAESKISRTVVGSKAAAATQFACQF